MQQRLLAIALGLVALPYNVQAGCTPRSSTSTTSSTTSTTSSTTSTTSSTTSSQPSSTSTGTPCFCTEFTQIAPAVAACTTITLSNINAPTGQTINLSNLKNNAVVIFDGLTTFAFTNSSSFNPITISTGVNVTITSNPGAVIDGGGQMYWDGQGSNGGVPKPDHFVSVGHLTGGSVIENLYIQNYPTHCFSVSNCASLTMRGITIDNRAGDAPNAASSGLPAAHNSDGFDVSGSTNMVISGNTVWNQDDCVAITSGNNITVQDMFCSGGHGLSIGSVGGKSNNNVTNISFLDSIVIDSQNGPRIKTNFNTTGYIANITYSNIAVYNTSIYGIDVQQDYLNGGPTGIPSNGVIITNLLFQDIFGTAQEGAQDYYILCGNGSCSNFVFNNVDIVGGGIPSSCDFPPSGCP